MKVKEEGSINLFTKTKINKLWAGRIIEYNGYINSGVHNKVDVQWSQNLLSNPYVFGIWRLRGSKGGGGGGSWVY